MKKGIKQKVHFISYNSIDIINFVVDNSLLYRDVQLYVDVWRNTKGETSLHISARKGDVTILNQLVADKIDLNIQDNAGWTALVNIKISCLKLG